MACLTTNANGRLNRDVRPAGVGEQGALELHPAHATNVPSQDWLLPLPRRREDAFQTDGGKHPLSPRVRVGQRALRCPRSEHQALRWVAQPFGWMALVRCGFPGITVDAGTKGAAKDVADPTKSWSNSTCTADKGRRWAVWVALLSVVGTRSP